MNVTMASNTVTSSIIDEDNWVIQIDKMYSELDLNYLRDYPVCIYHVPTSLSSAKPEAFTPQLVALGPYHHFRPELYPMERFKLMAAKRVLKNHELKEVVEKLSDYSPEIRACYHKYLDLKDGTLIYTMVIDSLCLLDLLHNYASFTKMDHTDPTRVKLTKDAMMRDVLMVENQIPACMMREMIMTTKGCKDKDAACQEIGSLLLSLCDDLSPLPFEQNFSEFEAGKHAHLLDLMYHLIMPPRKNNPDNMNRDHNDDIAKPENMNDSGKNPGSGNKFVQCLAIIKKVFGKVSEFLEKIISWLNHVPALQPIAKVFDKVMKALHLISTSDSEFVSEEKDAPVVVIPSVTELHDIGGVRFRPSSGGLTSIRFDEKKGIFYLPVIELDVNSEVIMRNLVAYEALTNSESLLLTRYTELMRGIIDTVEDVQVLEKSGVIKSNLKDKEAEELFNGMSKSIGPTKTPNLDTTIEKVNAYFNNTRKVRAYKFITKYVYSSWKLCTVLVTLVLLGMTALQTICSVYDCPRVLKTSTTKVE